MSAPFKPQNTLRVHMEKYEALEEVVNIIKKIPKLQLIKNDPELLKWLMEKVLSTISSKVIDQLKVDELVFEALCEVFPAMSENEKDFIKKTVEFLVNNKQIRKNSYLKKKSLKLLNFLKKK